MKFLSEKNPDTHRTFEIINEGLSKKAVIVIMACCKVNYEGRARSKLGSGDRMIIIKSDGSFMVHQNINLEPVNWQPPKSQCKASLKEGIIYLEGSRRNPLKDLRLKYTTLTWHRISMVKIVRTLNSQDMRKI